MKKIIFAAVAAVVMISVFASCGNGNNTKANEMKKTQLAVMKDTEFVWYDVILVETEKGHYIISNDTNITFIPTDIEKYAK